MFKKSICYLRVEQSHHTWCQRVETATWVSAGWAGIAVRHIILVPDGLYGCDGGSMDSTVRSYLPRLHTMDHHENTQ